MSAIAAISIILLGTAPVCGLPPLDEKPAPIQLGERLSYDLEVMGVVKAGKLAVTVEPPISRGSLFPIRARIKNTSVFAKVRRIDGFALSWIRAGSFRPQRYRESWEEDGVRKATDTRFDLGDPLQIAWAIGSRKGTATYPSARDTLDLVSTIYYLRVARLQPGEAVCFDLVGARLWHLQGRVAPELERVTTEAGTFETVRIDGEVRLADRPRRARPVHLWFSRDARRLPVAAMTEIDLGPVSVKLSGVHRPTGSRPESTEGTSNGR